MKTLVAFANTAGGILLIGVENDHTVIGIPGNPLDEEERLSNIIADSIAPRLIPNNDFPEKTCHAQRRFFRDQA